MNSLYNPLKELVKNLKSIIDFISSATDINKINIVIEQLKKIDVINITKS